MLKLCVVQPILNGLNVNDASKFSNYPPFEFTRGRYSHSHLEKVVEFPWSKKTSIAAQYFSKGNYSVHLKTNFLNYSCTAYNPLFFSLNRHFQLCDFWLKN